MGKAKNQTKSTRYVLKEKGGSYLSSAQLSCSRLYIDTTSDITDSVMFHDRERTEAMAKYISDSMKDSSFRVVEISVSIKETEDGK